MSDGACGQPRLQLPPAGPHAAAAAPSGSDAAVAPAVAAAAAAAVATADPRDDANGGDPMGADRVDQAHDLDPQGSRERALQASGRSAKAEEGGMPIKSPRPPRDRGSRSSGKPSSPRKRPVYLRKGERQSVEQFLLDKQRGLWALQKRAQVEEDAFVFATEDALGQQAGALQRHGVAVPERGVVLESAAAFQTRKHAHLLPTDVQGEHAIRAYKELCKHHAVLAAEINGADANGDDVESAFDDDDDDNNNLNNNDYSSENAPEVADHERYETDMFVDETQKSGQGMQESDQERQAREAAKVARKLHEEVREEEILEFYAQVDEVVGRISQTLNALNSDVQWRTAGPSADPKEVESKAVSFFTEENVAAHKITKETLDDLTRHIRVDDFAGNLLEISAWVQQRGRASLHDEQRYFQMLRQLEDQETETEAASRAIQVILQEKEMRSKHIAAAFGDSIAGFRDKSLQMKRLLAKVEREAKQRRDDRVREGISMLESQIAMHKARLVDIDSEMRELDSCPEMQEEREQMLRIEAKFNAKTETLIASLEKVQRKSKLASKRVAVSDDILNRLQHISDRSELKLTKRLAPGPTKPEDSPKSSEQGQETGTVQRGDDAGLKTVDVQRGKIDEGDSEESDSDDEAFFEIQEMTAHLEELQAQREEIEAEREELNQVLGDANEELEGMQPSNQREQDLQNTLRELKERISAAQLQKKRQTMVDSQTPEQLEQEEAECKVNLSQAVKDLEEARAAKATLSNTLQRLETDHQALAEELDSYCPDKLAPSKRAQNEAGAGHSRNRHKRGPKGPEGPPGDEAEGFQDSAGQDLASRLVKAYAAFERDAATGDSKKRSRTRAQIVRGERVVATLVRAEESTLLKELAALQRDTATLESIRGRLKRDVETFGTKVHELDQANRGLGAHTESERITQRREAAEEKLQRLQSQVEAAQENMRATNANLERTQERQLEKALKEVSQMADEVQLLQTQLARLSSEASVRKHAVERAEALLRRQKTAHRKIKDRVEELRIETEHSNGNNPAQRAKRVRRHIKSLEMENVKLHRTIRDLKSKIKTRERERKKLLEMRAAAIKRGEGPGAKGGASMANSPLFPQDDEETRQRKKELRKRIRQTLRELARWRQRWQMAKQASNLAAAKEKASKASQKQQQKANQASLTAMSARQQSAQVVRPTQLRFDMFDEPSPTTHSPSALPTDPATALLRQHLGQHEQRGPLSLDMTMLRRNGPEGSISSSSPQPSRPPGNGQGSPRRAAARIMEQDGLAPEAHVAHQPPAHISWR
ncbi:Uncharacterized protein SCF082_LOCUS4549 [Durusdinium trenchii]|uniref:Uncharacterized protein n=1 Tax=Durusdinium trenchii TaxID=1381693 RepID=A0ABP0I1P5_9DINO